MTTTAFTLMFLPACLAVPVGLALGAVVELVIEGIGAVFAPAEARAAGPSPAPAGADDRREPSPFGLCGGRGASGRRDELALLDGPRAVGPFPWM